MVSCESCGSIQITRAHAAPTDKAVALLTSKRSFVCRRCGWRGRRAWTDDDLAKLIDDRFSGVAEVDPSLVVLDDMAAESPARESMRTPRPKAPLEAKAPQRSREFDLSTLDLAQPLAEDEPVTIDPKVDTAEASRNHARRSRNRLEHARQREIVAAVAISVLVMLVIGVLGLTGSCVG